MADNVTGLILAGGQSTRFGSDKARHILQERPLIAHVYDALSTAADSVFLSTGSSSKRYGLPATPIMDLRPQCGPLGGIHAGLVQIDTPWLLVAACDIPFIQPSDFAKLLEARSSEVDLVVARASGRLHPTCACYNKRLLQRVEAQIDAGECALHALLDAARMKVVDLPSSSLKNINRLSDLPE